jgi:hypothetical protein
MTAIVALAAAGAIFAGCGGNGADALGRTACLDVQHSLKLYNQSVQTSDPATAKHLGLEATDALRKALQPAAIAGSEDGDWQALELTLSETSRVPERYLVTALTAQCAETLGNT